MIRIEESGNVQHYAIVEDGVVTNVVVWDEKTPYNPEGELVLIEGLTPEPGIGWDYDGKQFADNRPQPEPFEV
jgi:hypothetical protein